MTPTSLQVVNEAETGRRLARLGLRDATSCKGKASCLAEVGKQLQVNWLVMVSVSELEGDRSLGLELLEVATERVVERDAVLLAGKTPVTGELLEGFVAHTLTHAGEPKPATPIVASTPTTLFPKDAPTEPDLSPPPPPRVEPLGPFQPAHTRSVVLLSTGGVLLAGAAVLLGFGLTMNAKLSAGEVGPDGRVRSSLTSSEATAVATTTSVELGTAGAAAVLALALGTVGVLTW